MYSIQRLPPRELETHWIMNPFDILIVETMIHTDIFKNAEDYRTQVHVAYFYLSNYGWKKTKLAKLFNVDHKAIEKQLSLPLVSNENGRPPLLNCEQQLVLIQTVIELNNTKIYPTLYDIEQITIEMFKKLISIDTIRNYIISSEKFRIIDGEPQDIERVNVQLEALDAYYAKLEQEVNGVPASLVFNMDEAGQDEYIDTHSMKVIVPITYTSATIKIPVRRSVKRSTVIHCICCDGTYPKPLVIIPRKTLDSVILKKLTCQNVMIKFQTKGFTNTELMKLWLTEIFFPFVQQKWETENKRSGYTGDSILILDGCSAHAAALNQFDLSAYHLKIIFLVPHSSHLTQPLDLVTFSIQKLITIRHKIGEKLTNQTDQIRSIIKGIQQASISENIISAFESAGIFHFYNKGEKVNFNNYMPVCIVKKEFSRCYKTDTSKFTLENYRIDI